MEQVGLPVPMVNVKYTNHLNVIVAIIGVIVIVQTLTQTFWNSTPEKDFSVEVSATRPKIQSQTSRPATAGQRRSLVQPPGGLPGTVGAPSAATAPSSAGSGAATGRSRLLTPSPTQPKAGSGIVGAPSGASAGAPNVVSIPSAPTTAPSSEDRLQDDMSGGRSLRGQNPFTRGRSSFRSDSRSMTLPPPGGNDAAKRQPDPNAPPPPVRSSMPEQRVQ